MGIDFRLRVSGLPLTTTNPFSVYPTLAYALPEKVFIGFASIYSVSKYENAEVVSVTLPHGLIKSDSW